MNRFDRRERNGLRLNLGRVVLLLTLFFLPSPRVARAAELTPQQKLEMKQLYERATRAYDVGKYAEAIEFYQKAYEIGGDPPMLYNIAQSYRLNDQPADAVRFYRRYLQRAPSARNKDDVERKIAELEKIVEERRKAPVAAPPPTPPPATPPPITTVTPPPVQPTPPPSSTPTTTIEGGATTPSGEVTSPAAQGEGGDGHVRRIVGWSLVGLGGAAAVGAVIEGLIAKKYSDKVTSASQSNGKIEFDAGWEKEGTNANTAMIWLSAGAGAAVVAGIILVATAPSAAESPADASATAPTARATVAPWLGGGIVGAGATLNF
ncbi:MAG: Thiol-disulfide isomerase [Myxococcales bacterium]|nr:Thiol-disulfide isomerase [Myxococcales bacterium]